MYVYGVGGLKHVVWTFTSQKSQSWQALPRRSRKNPPLPQLMMQQYGDTWDIFFRLGCSHHHHQDVNFG